MSHHKFISIQNIDYILCRSQVVCLGFYQYIRPRVSSYQSDKLVKMVTLTFDQMT